MLAAARPQDVQEPEVKVLSERFEQDEQGSYQYGYELDNGQKVSGRAGSGRRAGGGSAGATETP